MVIITAVLLVLVLTFYFVNAKNKWRIVEIKSTDGRVKYRVQDSLFTGIPFIWWTYSSEFDSLHDAKQWIDEHVGYLESCKVKNVSHKKHIPYNPFDSNE